MSKIFITGASSGIGAALAAHYAREGAVLGLCARRLAPTQALLAGLGSEGACYPVDVTDAVSLQAAAADFTKRFGVPDVVIANAGIGAGTLTENAEDLPAFRRIMDTNVLGLVVTFQPFVSVRAGDVRLSASRASPVSADCPAEERTAPPSPRRSHLQSLRVEAAGSGVSVVTICPGYVRTPLTAANRYRMPFLIDADDAARRMARVIAAKRRFAVIPWRMGLVAVVLRALPRWLFDRLFARAPRKARGLPP